MVTTGVLGDEGREVCNVSQVTQALATTDKARQGAAPARAHSPSFPIHWLGRESTSETYAFFQVNAKWPYLLPSQSVPFFSLPQYLWENNDDQDKGDMSVDNRCKRANGGRHGEVAAGRGKESRADHDSSDSADTLIKGKRHLKEENHAAEALPGRQLGHGI